MQIRKFKQVNVLGIDFYVDWVEEDGKFDRIIAVKDVHGGRNFVYRGLIKDGKSVEDMLLEAVGIEKPAPVAEKKEEIVEEAPAAQVTEQPKEETSAKKGKKRSK